MINLILLAAGLSRRFGENKLLFEIEEKPMYRHVLEQALDFQKKCEKEGIRVRLILVTAYKAIGDYLLSEAEFCLEEAGEMQRILVYNTEPESGISHSILLGLNRARLLREDDCAMFVVCDQPWLTTEDMELLLNKFLRSGKGIGGLSFQGIMGNPVIFKKQYTQELFTLTGDEGGKKVVRNHPEDTFCCEVLSKRTLKDIDRKEEGINV